MARIKNALRIPQKQWIPQPYRDHANQPAVLMVFRSTNPECPMQAPLPAFAIQVYSTVPLDHDQDYIAICQYLAREIHDWPSVSFEIYGPPQADVFACVEHQRHEIFHRKNTLPGEGFFPGIAKAAPNDRNRLLQGFLLVITSHSFRTKFQAQPRYEAETGPLWVNFNRSFPYKTKVDLRSRLDRISRGRYDPSLVEESDICPEREEIVVTKCRDMFYDLYDLPYLLSRSHHDVMNFEFDYGLDEDEGEPSLSTQPPAPEVVESLQRKADSLSHDDFTIHSASQGAVVITSNPAPPEPDLQYIIYIAFPLNQAGLELTPVAQAFTASLIDYLPCGKTIHFEFHSASSQPLGAILASHRDLMDSRPEMAVGSYRPSRKNCRVFPQERRERDIPIHSDREPYRTFFVILDRPDFLTEPGVLFFLTDGNEITDEAIEKYYSSYKPAHERGDYNLYEVWRSAGMPEVARRLAMLPRQLALEEQLSDT